MVRAVTASNVKAVARDLLALLRGKAIPYRGPVMYPWGSDFHFQEAGHTFGNMSLVLREISAHPELYGATVRLSTLSEYFDHLHGLQPSLAFPAKNAKQAGFEWGWPKVVKERGLYPVNYTNESVQFQTGALTSQSAHKQHSRAVAVRTHAASVAHSLATAASHATALTTPESRALLMELMESRDAVAICQHHDSMPGTMEPAVLNDYTARLDRASAAAELVLHRSIGALAGTQLWNLSQGSTSTNFSVIVFNSLAHERTSVVNVTLPNTGPSGRPIRWSARASNGTDACPAQFDAFDPRVVHFVATVPPLGYSTFEFKACEPEASCPQQVARPSVTAGALPIENGALSLTFESGLLASITTSAGVSMRVSQEIAVYRNGTGGAYILIETASATPLPLPERVVTVVGPVISEIVQHFEPRSVASSARQRIRLLHHGHQDAVEVTQMLGSLELCRELISRYHTDLSPTAFQTDSTGYEDHVRAWDTRGIGANYHAMVQRASLVETESGEANRQLAVLTMHTMGAASLAGGQLEHMLIRRLNTTDNQGPAPLNEPNPINITVRLLVGLAADVNTLALRRALDFEHPLLAMPVSMPPRWPVFSPLMAILPIDPDAFLLGLSVRWGGTIGAGKPPGANSTSSLVVRWMNTAKSGAAIPAPVGQLVQALTGAAAGRVWCTELTLSLLDSRRAADAQRLTWGTAGSPARAAARGIATTAQPEEACESVVLEPMDMRTFELTWELHPSSGADQKK